MAISTYKVFLMHKADGASEYTKLVDIKSYGDLGGSPENLETTTLSDRSQTYIPGIQSMEPLEFECNYDKADYAKLYALREKDLEYAVWFGGEEKPDGATPTGENGKFSFRGQLDVFVAGGGVNEVVGMTVTIAPSTVIAFAEA